MAGFPALEAAMSKVKGRGPHRIETRRLVCVEGCPGWLAQLNAQYPLPRDERIAVFFEDEDGIGEVIAYFKFMKKRRLAWTRSIISVASVEKKAVRAVQIADPFAQQAWRHLEKRQKHPPAEPEPVFARLLAGGKHAVKLLTEANIQESVKNVEGFLDVYPRGYVVAPRPRKPRKQ